MHFFDRIRSGTSRSTSKYQKSKGSCFLAFRTSIVRSYFCTRLRDFNFDKSIMLSHSPPKSFSITQLDPLAAKIRPNQGELSRYFRRWFWVLWLWFWGFGFMQGSLSSSIHFMSRNGNGRLTPQQNKNDRTLAQVWIGSVAPCKNECNSKDPGHPSHFWKS